MIPKKSDPKNTSAASELNGIVRKHVGALTHDIAEELTRFIVAQLLKDETDLVAPDVAAATESSPAIPWVSPTYNTKTRRWGCPRCHDYFDVRKRGVTTHIRYCTGTSPISRAVRAKFVPAMSGKSRKKKSSP